MARCVHQRTKAKRRSKAETQRKGRDESETCELCNSYLTLIPHMEIKYLKAKVWQGEVTKGPKAKRRSKAKTERETRTQSKKN